MNRVLAIDTSGRWGGLALLERRQADAAVETVAELGFHVSDSHAAHLIRRLELLLAETGWSASGLDAFVAVRGPGSFTGIRIGLGTVRGLSLANDRPCLGASSLEALVEAHGPAECDRVALIGAGRGEVYAARYDADSSPPLELHGPRLGLASRLVPEDQGPGVIVPAASIDRGALESVSGRAGYRLARAPRGIASAAGRLALLRGLSVTDPATSIAPLYVRPPDAELGPGKR